MITKNIEKTLHLMNIGLPLDLDVLKSSFLEILRMPEIKERDIFLASFLSFLMLRQNKEEIKASINAVIEFEELSIVPHGIPDKKIMGLAGSGKKGIKTVNISTPSAIIATSCGANIVKPGSQSTSSMTGSADFFSFLGINLSANLSIKEMLDETGFAFISIENRLAKFDKVYGHRFYIPTVLGFVLATISIPVVCDQIIYGLAYPNQNLSFDLINELKLGKPTIVSTKVQDGVYVDEIAYGNILIKNHNGQHKISPCDFIQNWGSYSIVDFQEKSTLADNVLSSVRALKGENGPLQDLYSLNSGLYLYEIGIADSLENGYKMSLDSLKNGKTYQHFRNVLNMLGGNVERLDRI